MHKYFVIVPAHNEAKNIRRCIENIYKYSKNIIVVDDGSSDKTGEILDSIPYIHAIHLPQNGGKGRAMRVGAEAAWGMGATGVIFMDGDNQHDSRHIPEFIKQLDTHNDIVIGIRILKTSIPWPRMIGNQMMVDLMKKLFNVYLPDMMCGYRAFTKKGYSDVKWSSNKYGVEIEMLTAVGRKNLPFKTVIVDTIYHDRYKGFSIFDGVKILLQIPSWYMRK